MHYDEIAFSIGKFPIYWYALLIVVGVILAVIVVDIEVRRKAQFKDLALDVCIISLPCGLIGARLLSCIFEGSFANAFELSFEHLMLYGAILLSFAGIIIYCKLRKISALDALDSIIPGLLVGIAVARWGDLFNRSGCGPTIKASWLKWIPIGMYNEQDEVCLSVFFLEFLVCIGIFLLIWLHLRKIKTEKGTVFFAGSFLYVFFAFFLEWLRTDSPVLWVLKANQWVSVAIMAAIILYTALTHRLKPMLSSLFNPERLLSSDDEQTDVQETETEPQELAEEEAETEQTLEEETDDIIEEAATYEDDAEQGDESSEEGDSEQ